MIPNRFSDEFVLPRPRLSQHALAGFLVIPVAMQEPGQGSPLPWLYQQMYQKALHAPPAPTWRDLFAVMN